MKTKYLFIDRDGTIIQEPACQQINHIHEIELLPFVIPALIALQNDGYQLVMVTNQDGLGTTNYPLAQFERVQEFLLKLLASQGVVFQAVLVCPHYPETKCYCRKPNPGLLLEYLANIDKERSYVIGDRDTDVQLADAIGVNGLLLNRNSMDWQMVANIIKNQPRTTTIKRVTSETCIECELTVGENTITRIDTGVPFFNHMLEQLAKHAGLSLLLKAQGDLVVDDHHLIEDTAIVLGEAIKKVLGNKRGIARYGFLLPMDEALATIAIDLSGRSYFRFDGQFLRENIGEFATEMVAHFFRSFSMKLEASLHVKIEGSNTHHMIEAIFKGVGRCLRQAMCIVDQQIPTTKGVL